MPVIQRRIQATRFKGASVLGAVSTPLGVLAAFPDGTPTEVFDGLSKIGSERGTLAYVSERDIVASAQPELEMFKDKRVLLAIRNGETPQAVADWLRFHHEEFDVAGALILNRARPDSDDFVARLQELLQDDPTIILVIDADTALGAQDAPDVRDPAIAPDVRGDLSQIPRTPWHGALSAFAVYEILRHRFLDLAGAVALLDIADHLLPAEPCVFDRAEATPGQAIPLVGTEIYPWRLRQNRPAPFADHLAKRKGERRRLLSWCACPKTLPADCIWQPGRPLHCPLAKTRSAFVRAMGIVFPGVPVETIVKKSGLTEDADLIALAKRRGHKPVRLPKVASIPARPPNGSVAIVSVMKNEGPYILDWIAHNRAIGVDRFLIYTNDCDDGTEQILDGLADAGVARRDNPFRETGQGPQYAAFSAAERDKMVTSADWLLTLDVDEYINVHVGNGRLSDLLDAVPEAHVFSLPWRLFGNADLHTFEDSPVSEQFTLAAPRFMPRPYQAWAFKSLYRNVGLFKRLGVHRPKGVPRAMHDAITWVNGAGAPLSSDVWRSAWRMGTASWGYDLVTLNHYAVRSAESFLIKRDRGRVNHIHETQDEKYWFRMNHNCEEDTSIQRLASDVSAEKTALMALPGIKALHAKSVDWHKHRIAQLKAVPDMRSFYDQITSPRMEKLSRLGPHFGMTVFMEGPQVVPDAVVAREPGSRFHFTIAPMATK